MSIFANASHNHLCQTILIHLYFREDFNNCFALRSAHNFHLSSDCDSNITPTLNNCNDYIRDCGLVQKNILTPG